MTEAAHNSQPEPGLAFARTSASTRLHLVDCPHLVGRVWHLADDTELAVYAVCGWSQNQLNGVGRSHPATIDDAMRDLGLPVEVRGLVHDHLRFVTYDEIWLPYSKSYVALGLDGRAVASFGKGYVWVGGTQIQLPTYAGANHEGHVPAARVGETCPNPNCHYTLPLTGICDFC